MANNANNNVNNNDNVNSLSGTMSNLTNTIVNATANTVLNGTAILGDLHTLNSLNANGTDLSGNDTFSGLSPNGSGTSSGVGDDPPRTPTSYFPDIQDHLTITTMVGLSFLFFVIVVVGIVGNALVIFVVLTDRKMRQSVTNMLILNLAVADLVIMALGVPEIVQFIMDKGWLLGPVACRVDRFLLVVCLYASVLSLGSVCIERTKLASKTRQKEGYKKSAICRYQGYCIPVTWYGLR